MGIGARPQCTEVQKIVKHQHGNVQTIRKQQRNAEELVRGHAGSSNRAIDILDERIISGNSVFVHPPASIRPPYTIQMSAKRRIQP